jgi:SPP1 gp7 family putative phage head morphogenesis protein
MPDSPASIGFNVPFEEAIAAMDARGIALPAQYYGEFQGIQRQLNFSIAGVASLDQLQAVLDSLTAKLAEGQSFKEWQDSAAVQDLGLPKHRLDNIFRTNIQNAYNRGHWEQFKENEKFAPYLMYDAINDSRTRPSHAALDGIIRRVDDPFWDTHYPANGYRCRCSVVSLSEKQAQARSKGDNGLNKKIEPEKMKPDKGWDYNCGSDITAGINKAIADRMAKAAAKTVEPKLAKSLKKKIVVPKDDPLNRDNIVVKKASDKPPQIPKTQPKEDVSSPPKGTFKQASETPQTDSDAKHWSKRHIDGVQEQYPYKFENGVFNPDIIKTGGKIKNTKTGETWSADDVKKSVEDNDPPYKESQSTESKRTKEKSIEKMPVVKKVVKEKVVDKKSVDEVKPPTKPVTVNNSKFVPSKNAKSAAKYLTENNIVDNADFGNLTDMDLINDWSRALFDTISEFPELRKNQQFTGSMQVFYERKRKSTFEAWKNWKIKSGMSESEAIEYTERNMPPIVPKGVASSSPDYNDSGISFNENHEATYRESFRRAEESGHWAVGSGNIKYIVDHELGHQLDDLLDLSRNKEVKKAFNKLKKSNSLRAELSGYVEQTESIKEFIAEAWAEYRNNAAPRPIAKLIGETAIAEYKGQFGGE